MTKRQIDIRVAKLDALDKEIKKLNKQAESLKKELQTELGENELLNGDHWTVKWTKYGYKQFEKKRLPQELIDQYTTVVERRRFDWNPLEGGAA